jgi:uncharacterized protein (TIGR03546 family)
MGELFQPFQYLIKIFVKDDSPRQLALGVALGTMIGLIPKGNLIVVGLSIFMFAFRVNLGTSLLMIFSVTALSAWIDPLTHAIGHRILAHPVWANRWSDFFDTPLVPWTSLNNTVVLGGFVLGCGLFYPLYHISNQIFHRHYAQAKHYATYWKHRGKKVTSTETDAVSSTQQVAVPVDWRQA